MTILFGVATHPKISAFVPNGPHAAPLGEIARKLRPALEVTSIRGDAGIGVALAGACAPSAIVTWVPAATVTVPPAFAVTCSVPSSTWYVVWVPPAGSCWTSVRNAVPRTTAVVLGVFSS